MEVKIKFSEESWKELKKLRKELGVASKEDVIREALKCLKSIRKQIKEGSL